ncbi:MAG: glycosyltransferase family 2 protein [Elusimicrobia bacterium]|nr:glycosyltransferase family 2 protein [Elusimicrobiota bacterium]
MISVVVPLRNESAGIEALEASLSKLRDALNDKRLELVFIDDGSTDGTADRIHKVFCPKWDYKLTRHETNLGVGAAFRTGFDRACGEIVCTIDADCTYPPEELSRLVAALEQTGADVATASPYHPEAGVTNAVPWRLFLSRGLSFIYRRVSPVRIHTYTSIFRAYRRPVIRRVSFQASDFICAAEILFLAAAQGRRILEVPMPLRVRQSGRSKLPVWKTILGHLRLIDRILRGRLDRNASAARPG